MPLLSVATEIDICNLALRKVGAQSITTFDDSTDAARLVKMFYPRVRDIVLRLYPWNCATKRAALSLLAESPAFGFANQFSLPVDCLFVQRMDDQNIPFKIEGRNLLTDNGTANIIYTARMLNTSSYDFLLVQAIYTYFAAEISTSLRQGANVYQALMNEVHQRILPQARSIDSQENSMQTIESTEFLTSRYRTGEMF